MKPLKAHLLHNTSSACGKTIPTKHLHPSATFSFFLNRCKKCDLIYNLNHLKGNPK